MDPHPIPQCLCFELLGMGSCDLLTAHEREPVSYPAARGRVVTLGLRQALYRTPQRGREIIKGLMVLL